MMVTVNFENKFSLGEKLKAAVFRHTPGVSRTSDNRTDFDGVEVEVKNIYVIGNWGT